MTKAERIRTAKYRKHIFLARGLVYRDLAWKAGVTYSMAEKWMSARRVSGKIADAYRALTGHPATPSETK